MLLASLDGMVKCRACGESARLDVLSRCMIACVLAVALPGLYLYGGVFYSGHFFLISLFLVLGAWRMLSVVGLPFLTLEVVPGDSAIDRRQSILILIVLLMVAIIIDGYMSFRFDYEDTLQNGGPTSAVQRDR